MRRRNTPNRKPAKARNGKTTKPRRSKTPNVARRTSSFVAELQKQVSALTHELAEAREQQTATSEVLRVISSSPGELIPVFNAILDSATRICEAKFGMLGLYEDGLWRTVAVDSTALTGNTAGSKWAQWLLAAPRCFGAETALGRIAQTKQLVHIADLSKDIKVAGTSPIRTAFRETGARSLLAAPLLKEGELLGAIAFYRQELRPFTDRQIALLNNFAAQAVIAIENTRLLSELRARTDDLTQRTADLTESLEQQTATSEVLRIISSSPGELQPVFASILDSATRLCEATFGILDLHQGGVFRTVAMHNPPPELAETRRRNPVVPAGPLSALGRVTATKQPVHVLDYTEDLAYKQGDAAAVNLVDRVGARTVLVTPMLKENEIIGAIAIFRQEVRPFTDKQIELVENFTAQAVIAIENARLLNELHQRTADLTESLEQQTATSEVLQVISSSAGNLEPVFGSMLENAVRICDAKFGILIMHEDGTFPVVAMHNVPLAFAELRQREPK